MGLGILEVIGFHNCGAQGVVLLQLLFCLLLSFDRRTKFLQGIAARAAEFADRHLRTCERPIPHVDQNLLHLENARGKLLTNSHKLAIASMGLAASG